MSKKAQVPAVVELVSGVNVFDQAAKLPNAIVLLDTNTISVKYTPAFGLFKPEVQQQLVVAEETNPILTLQRPLLPNGMIDTQSNEMIIAGLTDISGAYDSKKLGRLREFPGGYFIHTHFHAGAGCDFSYTRLEEALRSYCEFAYLLGGKDRPVVINLPGLQCKGTKVNNIPTDTHIEKVKDVIANTMFPNTTVYLVI